jgi:hypothetical protein
MHLLVFYKDIYQNARPNHQDVLHDFNLIKLSVASFVGTGSFLISFSNGHTKLAHRQLKKLRDYLKKCYSFNLKDNKQISRQPLQKCITDPLESGRGSDGIRKAHFRTHCSTPFVTLLENLQNVYKII